MCVPHILSSHLKVQTQCVGSVDQCVRHGEADHVLVDVARRHKNDAATCVDAIIETSFGYAPQC